MKNYFAIISYNCREDFEKLLLGKAKKQIPVLESKIDKNKLTGVIVFPLMVVDGFFDKLCFHHTKKKWFVSYIYTDLLTGESKSYDKYID